MTEVSGVCKTENVESFHCSNVGVNSSWMENAVCSYNSIHAEISMVLTVAGTIANILIVIVLLRPKMRICAINIILIAIALSDMSLMVTNFIYQRMSPCHLWAWSYGWMLYTWFYANVSVMAHSMSTCLTVAMAIIRYHIIVSKSSRDNHCRLSFIAIVLSLILVVAGYYFNLVRNTIYNMGYYEMPYEKWCPPPEGGRINMSTYTLGQRLTYTCTMEKINYWLTGILFKVLPCLLLTVFMTLLIQQILKARQRHIRLKQDSSNFKGDKTTVMLVAIVAVFMVTELPQGTMSILAGLFPQAQYWYEMFGSVLDLLSLLNSSLNFVLYCSMSSQFRTEFADTFSCLCQWIPWHKNTDKHTTVITERTNLTAAKNVLNSPNGNIKCTIANTGNTGNVGSNGSDKGQLLPMNPVNVRVSNNQAYRTSPVDESI